MLSKTNLKNQAKNFYKKTLAGPGKFGVFILLCILIIFSFESLGLTNKESNLEIRTINRRVVPVKIHEKKAKKVHVTEKSSNSLDDKLKIFTEIDNTRRILEREKILFTGAYEQKVYENTFNKEIEIIKNNLNNDKVYTNEEFFFDA